MEDIYNLRHKKSNLDVLRGLFFPPKNILAFLKIRHNPELVNLFLIEFIDELIGRVLDILACGDCTADNEDICTGFQCVLDDIDPVLHRQLRQGVFHLPLS